MPIGALLPILAGAGSSILGSYLQNRSQNQTNAFDREIYEKEVARRNMLQGMVAPSMLMGLGVKNPAQIGQMARNIAGGGSILGGGGGTPPVVPPTPGASAGLGILGAVAGGIPGYLGVQQIGKGRRTADAGVAAFENPFGAKLAKIAAGQGGLPELQAAYNEYMQAINAWKAAGGNHRKVAEQSLANRKLQDTVDTLFRQLGGSR